MRVDPLSCGFNLVSMFSCLVSSEGEMSVILLPLVFHSFQSELLLLLLFEGEGEADTKS